MPNILIRGVSEETKRRLEKRTMKKLAAVLACACLVLTCSCTPAPSDESERSSNDAETTSAAEMSMLLDGVLENGQALSDQDKAALTAGQASYTDNPQVVYQYPELESGCEIAALASALNSLEFDVTATEIADEYLVVDGDYEFGYLASPHTDFGGGFPPGVADAANAFLQAQGSSLRARDLTGSTFGGLSALVGAGYPVCVWTTLEQTPPNYDAELGAIGDWYVNEHCMTVYGIDGDSVTAADPLKGMVELDTSTFANVYTQCGSRALVIR